MSRSLLRTAIGVVAITILSCAKAPKQEAAPPSSAADSAAAAPAGSDTTRAPLHGGAVTSTAVHRFESVLSPKGLFVYAYKSTGAPMMTAPATGTATLRWPDGATKELTLTEEDPSAGEPAIYFCPMHQEVVRSVPGVCELCGGMVLYTQDRLAGRVDLTRVGPTAIQATIRLTNLSPNEPQVEFTQELVLAANGTPPPAAPQ